MLAKQMDKLTDENMAIPVMFKEKFVEKCVLVLMKCHSLTLHLLAHNWSKYHSNINTWFCPLPHKMIFWYRQNNLSFLDDL